MVPFFSGFFILNGVQCMKMNRKVFRQNRLLEIIFEAGYIPTEKELAEMLNVTSRTIHSDLQALKAALSPDAAVDEIRQRLMLRLRARVPKMTDRDLIRLAEFFLTKKSEVKSDVEASVTIKAWNLGEQGASKGTDG